MDEVLHASEWNTASRTPRTAHGTAARLEAAAQVLRERSAAFADAAAAQGRVWKRQGIRVYHRRASAAAGKPRMARLPFLALSAVLGVAVVTTLMYTPAYVVHVDGVEVGLVRDPAVFEQAAARVEARTSQILGQEYHLDHTVEYTFALTQQEDLSPVADFETYLFDGVSEVMKSYVLTVDGQFVGAAVDRAVLDDMLAELAAPYVTENTTKVDYTKSVYITREYTPADIQQDVGAMEALLTENTNGQTTYEVERGDTFMALAYANGMTMEEMEALNPDVDINRLYIGQILNVKEEIPFLGIQTVDSITYTEPIECEVREVPDDTMYQGESKVLDPGIPGEALVTADVTYVNGVEKGRDITATEVVREATEKVVAVGTVPRPTWYPTGNYIWPVYGTITSNFGYRYIFGSYSYHSGMDIAVPYGTAVKASDGGTVVWSGWKGSYGNLVIIDHGNGEQTYYGHNSSLYVSVGDKVYQGQTIAGAGSTGNSTGNHCHFEIKINGTSVNPRPYLS